MVLSDTSIRELLKEYPDFIQPLPKDMHIQPASIDLSLGSEIRFYDDSYMYLDFLGGVGHNLHPGEFILGQTKQYVNIPSHLVGQLNGKSTLGRQGLMVHSTAGYIDPGFSGNITLELKNIGHNIIHLRENMLIAQLILIQLTTPAERPYGSEGLNSHYQGQTGAAPAWNK